VTGQYFYQKNVPAGAPEWVKTKKRRETEYVVADSLSTLIWLANSNAVEFHLSLDRTEGVGVPNFAVLDLDPTAPAGFGEAVEVAKHLRSFWKNSACGDIPSCLVPADFTSTYL